MPHDVLFYVAIDERSRSTVFIGLCTTRWARCKSAVGKRRYLKVDLEEVLLFVESGRLPAGTLTSEGQRDGLDPTVRCHKGVEIQACNSMLGQILTVFAVVELHVDGRVERDAPPALMCPVRWRAFHLLASIIDGKPPIDSTTDLDADHRASVDPGSLEREGKACRSRFGAQREVKRQPLQPLKQRPRRGSLPRRRPHPPGAPFLCRVDTITRCCTAASVGRRELRWLPAARRGLEPSDPEFDLEKVRCSL